MTKDIKERPILFNGAMVRAVLSGSKTQTRRLVKAPKQANPPDHWTIMHGEYLCWPGDDAESYPLISPYGQRGDQLWVRENFQPIFAEGVTDFADVDYKTGEGYAPVYPATDKVVEFVSFDGDITTRCTPSIHMPRWASRIQLEITGVRVERLNDISEEDALAEGVEAEPCDHKRQSCDDIGCCGPTAIGKYRWLWESINGEGSWAANPWVWVVEFKVIKP